MSSIFAGLFFIAAVFMIPYLVNDAWHWYLVGAGVGCILAATLMQHILAGATCQVDNDDYCAFGFGKRLNLRFRLADAVGFQMIAAGPLSGVGVDIPLESIEILHRKGLSISKMRSYHKQFGCHLVLECLSEEDLLALRSFHAASINQDSDE